MARQARQDVAPLRRSCPVDWSAACALLAVKWDNIDLARGRVAFVGGWVEGPDGPVSYGRSKAA